MYYIFKNLEKHLSNSNSKPYYNLTQQRSYISSSPTIRRGNQLQRLNGGTVNFDLYSTMPLRTSTPSKNGRNFLLFYE